MEYVCPSRTQKCSWEAGPDKRKVNPWVQEGPSQPGPTIEMYSALGMFTETGEGHPQAAEVRKEAVKKLRLWSHKYS